MVPVRTSCAEPGAPPLACRPVTPGTGDQSSVPAGLEYRENVVQPAAKSAPVPAHRAQTAKTMPFTVSRSVTRIPWVGICAQCLAAVVGGVQLRPERPGADAVQGPDLADPGAAVRRRR